MEPLTERFTIRLRPSEMALMRLEARRNTAYADLKAKEAQEHVARALMQYGRWSLAMRSKDPTTLESRLKRAGADYMETKS